MIVSCVQYLQFFLKKSLGLKFYSSILELGDGM